MKNSVLLLMLFFLFACSKDNTCDTPFGDGAQIDINMPDFTADTKASSYDASAMASSWPSSVPVPIATTSACCPSKDGRARCWNVPHAIHSSRPNTAIPSRVPPPRAPSTNTTPSSTGIS